jgi:hypothetical protein
MLQPSKASRTANAGLSLNEEGNLVDESTGEVIDDLAAPAATRRFDVAVRGK